MKAAPRAVWLASDASVQHLQFAEVHMGRPVRLFLCAHCRAQVVLCSHCDRGNRYCGRPCWRLARDAARRDQLAHAERSRRGRQRRWARGDRGDEASSCGMVRQYPAPPPGRPDVIAGHGFELAPWQVLEECRSWLITPFDEQGNPLRDPGEVVTVIPALLPALTMPLFHLDRKDTL
jgi:hypothetical protein